jgi:hypothetical protein
MSKSEKEMWEKEAERRGYIAVKDQRLKEKLTTLSNEEVRDLVFEKDEFGYANVGNKDQILTDELKERWRLEYDSFRLEDLSSLLEKYLNPRHHSGLSESEKGFTRAEFYKRADVIKRILDTKTNYIAEKFEFQNPRSLVLVLERFVC